VGAEGSVVLADINPWMLVEAKRRSASTSIHGLMFASKTS